MKVFSVADMPEKIRKDFEDELGWFDLGWRSDLPKEVAFITYKISLVPSPEFGNLKVYNSKWFMENGAAKEEEILVHLGER